MRPLRTPRWIQALSRAALWAALAAAAFPVWWPLWFMAAGALTSHGELLRTVGPALGAADGQAVWRFIPATPTLQPAAELLLDTPQFFTMLWNSLGQVLPQLAGQLAVGAPAAWALSRLRFRGRGLVRTLYIVIMLMPFQVTMVPNYLVLNALGLLDSPLAIILPGMFSAFPVFIMQRGFDAVPQALLEAAEIDGAAPWQVFTRIGLPLGAPGILAALTMGFLDGWNALEQPMVFLKTPSRWPLSLYLAQPDTGNLGVTMAAGLAALLPALAVFRCGQTYLLQGISAGALKE